MSDAPITHIDVPAFVQDPYPALAAMQRDAPVTFVPQLGATLITRRDDIYTQEKRIDVFSSDQPNGLLTKVMGANMMRKDGDAHMSERKALFPALSPRTVRDHLEAQFRQIVQDQIAQIRPLGACNLVKDYAMPVAANALRVMTGLTNMAAAEMDAASQAMLDAAANYQHDPDIDAKGYAAADTVMELIRARLVELRRKPDLSIISVLDQGGLSEDAIAGNVRVIIGGGQNEPRDAIAGLVWALLSHPEQMAMIQDGTASFETAFDEYIRWIAPIGMSPRRVARKEHVCGVTFEKDDLVFFMFGAAGRDPDHFTDPEKFEVQRETRAAVSFGAGPHFCAGAAASRVLIARLAVPMLFKALPGLALDGPAPLEGWAFRGPLSVPVRWSA